MGWNGSGQKGAAPVQPKVTAKKPSPIRGLIAGGVVVVLAVAAYFAFFSESDKPQTEKSDKGRGRIKAVTPAAAPKTNTVAEVKKPVDPKEDYDHTTMYRDERGILRYNSGCRAPDPTRKARVIDMGKLTAPSPFKNVSDRAIASILTLRPGQLSLATWNFYDPEFEEAFKKSLSESEPIGPDDSESLKETKKVLWEAKCEIAKRLEKGEVLGDILSAARQELRDLHDYKFSLEKEVNAMVEKGGMEEQDVRDIIAAANKMLADKGVDHQIEDEDFVRWNLRLTAESKGADPDAAEAEYDARQAQKKEAEQLKESEKENQE